MWSDNMKLTKKKAKELSLIKWDYNRKTGCTFGEMEREIKYGKDNKLKQLKELDCYCGYCEKYEFNHDICPLENCTNVTAKWSKWYYAKRISTRKKYAEQIYKDIERS
jgi:hypothetical protein